MPGTTIASFIVRFVQETTNDPASTQIWRGIIRHVQTGEESFFTRIDDALTFISRYVDLRNTDFRDQGR